MREVLAVDVDEELPEDEVKAALVRKGVCRDGVTIDAEERTLFSQNGDLSCFRKGQRLWLSRTNPKKDAFKHGLTIQSVIHGRIGIPRKDRLPDDADTGTWRIDVAQINEWDLESRLADIEAIATDTRGSLQISL